LKITAQYEESGNLTEPSSLISADGMTLFTDDKNAGVMTKQLSAKPAIAEYLRVYLDQVKRGDYVDFSAFIEMSDENTTLLQQCRTLIRDRKKVATCLGFGPRFLHSTGQAYKGGPNTGVFLQITADHLNDIQVPEHRYTFGLVITAQAQADFNVLIERSRRILRIHLVNDVKGGLQRLFAELKIALQITEQT
jgi:hypothetical protein